MSENEKERTNISSYINGINGKLCYHLFTQSTQFVTLTINIISN